MSLLDDSLDAKIMTLNRSTFPEGTIGRVIQCEFIEGTTERVYLFQTNEDMKWFVKGIKCAWYLDRDLINV